MSLEYLKPRCTASGKWRYTRPIAAARRPREVVMEERRQHARYDCSLKVHCKLDHDEAIAFDAVGLNISERGMFMRPSGGLQEGQAIRLRYTLPDGTEVRNARALVNRTEALDCVAVLFISVHPNAQEFFE